MIVCEVGINHLGSINKVKKYIDHFYKTDCDAITFQILKDSFYNNSKFKKYFIDNKDFYLIFKNFKKNKKNKKLLGVAIDDKNAILDLENAGVDFYKVLSKDIGNIELIKALLSHSKKKIYVSTSFAKLK